jgi:hypothetical protein
MNRKERKERKGKSQNVLFFEKQKNLSWRSLRSLR